MSFLLLKSLMWPVYGIENFLNQSWRCRSRFSVKIAGRYDLNTGNKFLKGNVYLQYTLPPKKHHNFFYSVNIIHEKLTAGNNLKTFCDA